ncbi:hypothetical protein [Sphingobium sp. Ant17]|uniref:hypothetical protein n=1 Tax=Sphingobium sp. Ant17 TaxID=1461752 RepID=UPI00126953FB|nr:hypothetical protein [Sphingobium sp. Ant17]
MTEKASIESDTTASANPICGVIMPISGTTNHSEAHWSDVQTLLHRAITNAGFQPLNVWENTSADRVSERIIANIFEQPLMVSDISDLNPNVMLELGLRLASKKPTIVIVNSGGVIPFDIRDFHAIIYPIDLNMLGMEEFFRKLSKVLKEKFTAYSTDDYQPFLGKVVVDVISPGHREVSFDVAIVDRLDDISSRLSKIESRSTSKVRAPVEEDNSTTTSSGNVCYFTAKGDVRPVMEDFKSHPSVIEIKILGSDGPENYLSVKVDNLYQISESVTLEGVAKRCAA